MIIKGNHKQELVNLGLDLGFDNVTFARAQFMEEEARQLESWLNKNYHGEMSYMANHFDMRVDPTKLVPGAKTVISLCYNYFPKESPQDGSAPQMAKYAYGRDYHKVVKKKLKVLLDQISNLYPRVGGRCFVDSAPVMERDWAKRSGMGWIGKNTLLIHPKKGSYFFLAEIILDLEIEPDEPMLDYCGTCTKCIEACPTDAISEEGFVVDGSQCISYLTIELKEAIPNEFKGKMENWMFGCDICQDVCPWNRFSRPHSEFDFEPTSELLKMTKKEWQELSEETFEVLFKGSPVKRTKFQGLKRNIDFLKAD